MSDNETSQRVGELRAKRLAAGLSQEQLAREVGCSTAYIRVLERGYVPDRAASPVYARVTKYLKRLSKDGDELAGE